MRRFNFLFLYQSVHLKTHLSLQLHLGQDYFLTTTVIMTTTDTEVNSLRQRFKNPPIIVRSFYCL